MFKTIFSTDLLSYARGKTANDKVLYVCQFFRNY